MFRMYWTQCELNRKLQASWIRATAREQPVPSQSDLGSHSRQWRC